MSRRLRHLLLGVVTAGVLTACGSTVAPAAGGGFDGDWTLTSGTLAGKQLTLTTTAPVTLTVDGSDVSGRSACNAYTGTVDAGGDSVTFSGLGGTDMGCEPDVMAVETAYQEALSQVTAATATAETLTLTGPDVELDFEPVAPVVAAPLIGTLWLLDTITDGSQPDASVSSPVSEPARLSFNADRTLSSLTGCKERSGTWLETDGHIETQLVVHPTPFCGAEVEDEAGKVLQVLDGPFTAMIDGDVLTLTMSDGSGLVYRASGPTPSETATPTG